MFKIYKINNSSLNKALIQIKVCRKKWINLVIFKVRITKVKVMCQIRPRRMDWWMKMGKTRSSIVILSKRWTLVKESNQRELEEAAKDKKLHLPAYLNKLSDPALTAVNVWSLKCRKTPVHKSSCHLAAQLPLNAITALIPSNSKKKTPIEKGPASTPTDPWASKIRMTLKIYNKASKCHKKVKYCRISIKRHKIKMLMRWSSKRRIICIVHKTIYLINWIIHMFKVWSNSSKDDHKQ